MFVDVIHLDWFLIGRPYFASTPLDLQQRRYEHLLDYPIGKRWRDVNDLNAVAAYAAVAMPPLNDVLVNANYFRYYPFEWYDCRHVPSTIYHQFGVNIMDLDGSSRCHTYSPDLYSLIHCPN